jgi:streptogramin lyase
MMRLLAIVAAMLAGCTGASADMRAMYFPVTPRPSANLNTGRAGEVWGAESGNDRLVLIRYRP